MAYFIEVDWPQSGTSVYHPITVVGTAWMDSTVTTAQVRTQLNGKYEVKIIFGSSTASHEEQDSLTWSVSGLDPAPNASPQDLVALLIVNEEIVAATTSCNIMVTNDANQPVGAPTIEYNE
jgi:hypothetical protein